jgi:hypothetical protein
LAILLARGPRTSRIAQQYIGRGTGVHLPDAEIDRISSEVIRGQDMAAVFAARRKEHEDIYARVSVNIDDGEGS